MDTTYTLFRGAMRVTMKEDDMSCERIGRIFQVVSSSLYVTDDARVAIFPGTSGYFSAMELTAKGHYEVHGVEQDFAATTSASQHQPQRFAFSRTASASVAAGSAAQAASAAAAPKASMAKSFQRSIYVAELVEGKLKPSRMAVVRFFEFEASVHGITGKVQEALGIEDPLVLTDAQGNELIESEGTKGSAYWKQNSRKVYAVLEAVFLEYQGALKRKRGRSDSTGLQDIQEKVEELLLASQSLGEVTNSIKVLSELASNTKAIHFVTDGQARTMKEAFACVVCKGFMAEPMFATCCNSLLGCRVCVEQWLATSDQCLRCRGESFHCNVHRVLGLSEVLGVIQDIV